MLDDKQRDQVLELISEHEINRRLSSGQKWDVAVLMASFPGGAIAVLGVAGYFVVENAAKVRAGQVAAGDVANDLFSRDELLARLSEAAIRIPSDVVVAFDRASGCPEGWLAYASARGRTIIGAAPPSGQAGGLTRREFQEQGGAEAHTLTTDEMPRHSHEYITYSGNAGEDSVSWGGRRDG